jgi:hypothetical protein
MTTGLRLRALVAEQLTVVVLVLLILAGIGGFLAYGAYAQPNTTVETTETTVWAADAGFTHQSTVVDNASQTAGIFAPGQTVANRSFYYTSIMSNLSGQFAFSYTAERGELDVTIERTLVIRSVGETAEGSTVEYWRETEPLGTTATTLAPGETATAPYRVNVPDTVARAERIRERLRDPGETEISVTTAVTLAGTAGGREVERTLEYTLPITVEGATYSVGSAGDSPVVTQTERTTVTQPPGPLAAYGGPALAGVALLGLVGIAYARATDRLALTEAEQAWLAYRDDRSDFDEWISTIRLPEEARSLPVAEADSLADLVDFAIDTDNAVLESPDAPTFHVVHDGYRYTFEAPPDPTVESTEPLAAEGEAGDPAGETADDDAPPADGEAATGAEPPADS